MPQNFNFWNRSPRSDTL